MLARIGASSIDALFTDVPDTKLLTDFVDLPTTKTELDVERHLGRLAGQNVPA